MLALMLQLHSNKQGEFPVVVCTPASRCNLRWPRLGFRACCPCLHTPCTQRAEPPAPRRFVPACRTQPTAEQKRLISEQLRRQREPGQPLAVLGSQRQQISELEAGPVVVRVLRPEEPSQASQSARDFLQQRLGGVKRSADMLKPVRALQPAHIAQRQVQHMAALHAQRRQSKQAAAVAAGGAPQAKRRR